MDEFFVITDGGQLLYSWHSEDLTKNVNANKDDDLIGGFLTAINTFATYERGEDIKSLKLKETTIIFERENKTPLNLTFIATGKEEKFIELYHQLLHEAMEMFLTTFREALERPYDGEVTRYRKFNESIKNLRFNYGLDGLKEGISDIDEISEMKSLIYIEPKGGHIFFTHAKQYVNKDKISFLFPLIVNSAKLLYKSNLKEDIHWILINTIKNEILLVELREKILIAKQYQISKSLESKILGLPFFEEKEKYVKKPKKIAKQFDELIWDSKIKQVYLVDFLGKIIFSKIIDSSYDCRDYIPETISFLTSAKKVSDEIYSRPLFNASIGGKTQLTTICLNLNNLTLTLIGNIKELNDFKTIQDICENIIVQLE